MDADERTRQLLRAYGERSAPSAEKRDRAWAAIAAAAAGPPATSGPATGNLVLKTVLGVGAMITIGLTVWSWNRTSDDAPDERPAPATLTAPASAGGATRRVEEEEVSVPEERDVTPSPSAAPSARVAEPSAPTHVPAPSEGLAASTPSLPAPAGTLAEELALMDRARQAIARSDDGAALEALDEHDTRFPAGTLARERDVLRVTALCAAGREDEAIAVAAAAGPRPAITRALSRCGAP